MDNRYTKDIQELADYILQSQSNKEIRGFYLGQLIHNFAEKHLNDVDANAKQCGVDIMKIESPVSQYAMIFDLFRALDYFASIVDIEDEEYYTVSLGVYDIINELCQNNFDMYRFLRILTDSMEYLIKNKETELELLPLLQQYLYCVTQVESAMDDYLAYYNVGGAEVEDDDNVLQVHNLITQDFLGRMYFDFVKKEDYQDDNILFEELLVLSEESFQVLKETYNDKVSYFDKVFQLNDLYEKERLKSAEEYCAVVNDFTLRKENLSLFNSVQTLIIYMDEIRSKYLYDKVDAKLHQKKFVTVEQYVKDNIELEYNMMPYYIDYMEKGISTLPADLLFNLELSNEEEQIDNLTNEEWDLLTSEITEAM